MNRVHRYLFLFTVLLLGGTAAYSQISVRAFLFNPYGALGETADKKVALELAYMDKFDNHLRLRATVGYHKLKPREEVFRTVGYSNISGTWAVYPGTLVYNKLNIISVSAGMDYAPVRFMDDRLSPYVGGSVLGGWLLQDYDSSVPGLSETGETASNKFIGLQPRVGVDMAFTDHIGAYFELACTFTAAMGTSNLVYSQHGLGVRYMF